MSDIDNTREEDVPLEAPVADAADADAMASLAIA